MVDPEPFASVHFTLQRLRRGVWAALHASGGWMVCNAGIVDLGGETLLFDTGLTPTAAEDLARACVLLTGRPPGFVLNSHYHNDHVRGNQVFADSRVLSGPHTRTLLRTRAERELEEDARVAPERLATYLAFADDPDPLRRRAAETFVPYWRGIAHTAPQVELRGADDTVAEERVFEGTERAAAFRVLGAAHTEEDAVLWLPDDGVLFCGDLLFVDHHPYLGHGDPDAWRGVLDEIEALDADALVPGHGPVGGPRDLERMREYFDAVEAAASRRLAAPEEDAGGVPEAYRDWDLAVPFFDANVQFASERLRARRETA